MIDLNQRKDANHKPAIVQCSQCGKRMTDRNLFVFVKVGKQWIVYCPECNMKREAEWAQ